MAVVMAMAACFPRNDTITGNRKLARKLPMARTEISPPAAEKLETCLLDDGRQDGADDEGCHAADDIAVAAAEKQTVAFRYINTHVQLYLPGTYLSGTHLVPIILILPEFYNTILSSFFGGKALTRERFNVIIHKYAAQ